jgi:hypothetical protein
VIPFELVADAAAQRNFETIARLLSTSPDPVLCRDGLTERRRDRFAAVDLLQPLWGCRDDRVPEGERNRDERRMGGQVDGIQMADRPARQEPSHSISWAEHQGHLQGTVTGKPQMGFPSSQAPAQAAPADRPPGRRPAPGPGRRSRRRQRPGGTSSTRTRRRRMTRAGSDGTSATTRRARSTRRTRTRRLRCWTATSSSRRSGTRTPTRPGAVVLGRVAERAERDDVRLPRGSNSLKNQYATR